MMTNKFSLTFDFPALQEKLVRQFRNLDPRDPSNWPSLPRYALFAVIAVVVLVVLWFLWLSATADESAAEQTKEVKLREEYKPKLGKAVNLEALKTKREQVQKYAHQLETPSPWSEV